MQKLKIVILMSLMASTLPLGSAMAQDIDEVGPDNSLPARSADRPLTLPQNTLRAEVQAGVTHLSIFDTAINIDQLNIGASYGITDDIEVGAVVAPLTLGLLDSETRYGDPSIRARYRFLDGTVEMAAEIEGHIPVNDEAESDDLTVRIPLRIQADALRVDTGLETSMNFEESGVEARLAVPVAAQYNITDELHAGLTTGFAIDSVDNAGDAWRMPLGASVGYTFGAGDLVTDVGLAFELPLFLANGEVRTEVWTTMLNANIHFGL